MTLAACILFAATFTRTLERVATMDSAFSQSVYDSRAVQLVYETPLEVDYEARPYRLVPGACELPSVSSDGLVYTFRMRSPRVGAGDVVRSLERLRDPELVSPNGWMMKNVDTMRVTDDGAVEVRLKSRQHVFPWLLAMSPAAVRLADGSGTGPFELVSWWKNHEMVFRRREGEKKGGGGQRKDVLFDEIRYLVVDDASTQWLMFLKGEIDFLGEISRDSWDAVLAGLPKGAGRKTPWGVETEVPGLGATLYTAPSLDVMHFGINMRDPVLGPNRKLRQALNAAFDYPAWETFCAGRIMPSDGPVPPGVAGRLETPFPYAFDLAKAKRLMTEAGYPDGIDPKTGRRLVLTVAVGRASQESREAMELTAAFYERIGIRLETRYYTWDAFLKATNEGRVQMFRMGWVGDYPDAENFLQLFHSRNVSPGPNHANYVNPAFDAAFDAAMAADTEEKRNAQWRICQEIVREDCPWVFTNFNKANTLVRHRVGNYIPGSFTYGSEARFTVREPKP